MGKFEHLRAAWPAASDTGATLCLGLIATSLLAQPLLAGGGSPEKTPSASLEAPAPVQRPWKTMLSQEEKIAQRLNRVTFGPRPGEAELVRKMGLRKFLDQQLHPETLPDSAVAAKLAQLPTLSMTPEELVENYPPPGKGLKRQQGSGDSPEANKSGLNVKGEGPLNASGETRMEQMQAQTLEMSGPQRVINELAQEELLRAVYSNRQLQDVMVHFWMNHFNIFAEKGAVKWLVTSFERDTIRPRALGQFEDLLLATAKSRPCSFISTIG